LDPVSTIHVQFGISLHHDPAIDVSRTATSVDSYRSAFSDIHRTVPLSLTVESKVAFHVENATCTLISIEAAGARRPPSIPIPVSIAISIAVSIPVAISIAIAVAVSTDCDIIGALINHILDPGFQILHFPVDPVLLGLGSTGNVTAFSPTFDFPSELVTDILAVLTRR
jgi:hypothetical protein